MCGRGIGAIHRLGADGEPARALYAPLTSFREMTIFQPFHVQVIRLKTLRP